MTPRVVCESTHTHSPDVCGDMGGADRCAQNYTYFDASRDPTDAANPEGPGRWVYGVAARLGPSLSGRGIRCVFIGPLDDIQEPVNEARGIRHRHGLGE